MVSTLNTVLYLHDDSKKMVKCTESIMVLAKALFLESAGMLRFVLDGMDDGWWLMSDPNARP